MQQYPCIMRLVLSLLTLILLVVSSSLAAANPAGVNSKTAGMTCCGLGIEVKDSLVSMDVKKVDITMVLREISQKAMININVSEGIKNKISIKMADVPLEHALKRICDNRILVYEFLPQTKTYRIINAGAFSEQKEKMTDAQTPFRNLIPAKKQGPQQPIQGGNNQKIKAGISGQPSARMYDEKGRPLYKPGELLVKFKTGVTQKQIAHLHRALGSTVIRKMNRLRLEQIKLKPGLSEQDGITGYSAAGIVETVEMHTLRYVDATLPNDPFFGQQWGLTRIQAPKAWDISRGSPEMIIAVIDTGVNYLQPDLTDNIWINADEFVGDANGDGFPGIQGKDDDGDGLVDEDSWNRQPGDPEYTNDLKDDDDENSYVDDIRGWDFAGEDDLDPNDSDADPMDLDGHGTSVAGIVAAKTDNGLGTAGLVWNAKIMVLKAQADNSEYMEDVDVISAIYYAIDNGARIVNCSFGGGSYQALERAAFADLGGNDILAVCAAGNDGLDTDLSGNENYPSNYTLSNIISVAASDSDDALGSFSNYGRTSVDVMAPGVNIKSTSVDTDAAVITSTISYSAVGMTYASITGESGITGLLYNCGKGDPAAAEFPPEVNGNIALIERGELFFSEKAANAQAAGAIAVVIYNNVPGSFNGTLQPGDWWIPVVSISKEDGAVLIAGVGAEVTVINKPEEYGTSDGTSMAAPHVTGIAALLLSHEPFLEYSTLKAAILDTVDSIPSVADRMVSGGRVNAFRALCGVNTLRGDFNYDKVVDLADAVLSQQIISGTLSEKSVCKEVEVDSDGRIGMEDILYILQNIVGMR